MVSETWTEEPLFHQLFRVGPSDRHVGVPGEIRGPSEQSAVVRVQGFRGVGLDQQRVPLGPPLPVDRVTGSIEAIREELSA